jgi:hypothetical protein
VALPSRATPADIHRDQRHGSRCISRPRLRHDTGSSAEGCGVSRPQLGALVSRILQQMAAPDAASQVDGNTPPRRKPLGTRPATLPAPRRLPHRVSPSWPSAPSPLHLGPRNRTLARQLGGHCRRPGLDTFTYGAQLRVEGIIENSPTSPT